MRSSRKSFIFESKIKKLPQLASIVHRLSKQGKRIVFTNGCFDLIHYGHVVYLSQAKAKGDILIVGVNSDNSVRRLKGPSRPIVRQAQRAGVLASLACVDYVCIFNGSTPLRIIQQLQPDVLVKGGDWKIKDIVGADIVLARKGKVYSISFVKGFSTTGIINKIAKISHS